MPQKAIFSRLPLMDQEQCPLSRGQVRASSPELNRLYHLILDCGADPAVLEASFSMSVLVCENPEIEPAALGIKSCLSAWEEGRYPDCLRTGLDIARAALCLYEYSTDKHILSVLASWCRKLETDWDEYKADRYVRIQPADLAEFLVRFYRITGLKAVLRLCARLRTAAMDWTTILQNEPGKRTSLPAEAIQKVGSLLNRKKFDTLEFDETQLLSHHSELLADGMRYTSYSAEYSGHEQELKAGRAGWEHLRKNHHAVCGGLSGDPFLAGGSTAAGIDPGSAAAWLEAMIAQMQIHSEIWAVDEATRLIHNAVASILKENDPCRTQYVNRIREQEKTDDCSQDSLVQNRTSRIVRIARAAALSYQYAFTTTRDSIRMNWFLPGRFLLQSAGRTVMIQCETDQVLFRLKDPVPMKLMIYHATTETATIVLKAEDTSRISSEEIPSGLNGAGFYLIMDREWKGADTLKFVSGGQVTAEKEHHQGISFFRRNRLMAYPVPDTEFRFIPTGKPETVGGEVKVPVKMISEWHEKDGIPADIPVLPPAEGKAAQITLAPYAEASARIAVFPGFKDYV